MRFKFTCVLEILFVFLPLLLQAQPTTVYFTPGGDAVQTVVTALDSAQTDVHMEATTILNKAIQQALVNAVERGVQIRLILDESAHSDGDYTNADFFSDWEIETYLYGGGYMQNSCLIIDSTTVLAGSYDFSGTSETASHVLQIADNPELASEFLTNFAVHLEQSEKLLPKRVRALQEEPEPVTEEAPAPAEKPEPPVVKETFHYVGNANSLTLHKSTCPSAKRLKDENKVLKDTRQEFIDAGYVPCGRCKP